MWAEHSSSHHAPPERSAPEAPPLWVVVNPGCRAPGGEPARELLARVFAEAGRGVQFVPVRQPQALKRACAQAAVQAREAGGVLVAVGGDGTINTVAEAALAQGCAIGVIPGGTFNYFAREHGIPQDTEAAARALLRARPQPVQVGLVNGQPFLVNGSLGLYPQLLQDRESFKEQLGRRRWVAVLAGLVTLFEWRRQLVLEIEMEGERVVLRTPTLFMGNNRLQLERIGIEPAVAGRVGEGRLAGIVLRPIGTWAMLLLVLRGALGHLGEADQVHSFTFRSLTVRPWRTRQIKAATDGEVRWMAPPLRFSVSPEPLMLMLPRPEDRVPVE